MRRTANKLQLEIAKDDWNSAVRSLQIFYGLNSMVRPHVMDIYSKLSRIPNPYEAALTPHVCH